MKRVKIFAAIFMIVCLCITITGCGNSSNPENVNSDSDSTNSVAENSTSQSDTKKNTDSSDSNKIESVSENKDESQPSEDTQKTGTDVLVVYFSATGTTKGVAEKLADVTGADIYEIIPAEPYTEADLNWHDSDSRTTHEQDDKSVRPGIASDKLSLDGYTTIYVGYPIWWGEEPRIMDTFVESYDFVGKTMIPFCTSGGSGIGSSGDNLKNNAGSGKWLEGARLDSGISESELQDFVNSLK